MNRFLATGLSLLFLVTGASAQDKVGASRNLPGKGVADEAGNVGFWPATTGGIEAVDLANGKVNWKSKNADQPLLAWKDRVLAQALVKDKSNQVRLVVLEAADGKQLLESKPIMLPDWVSVPTTYGRAFQSGAQVHEGEALYFWTARGWYAGGAAPPPEVLKAAMKNGEGYVRMDLETGALSMAKNAPAAKMKFAGETTTAKLGQGVLRIEDVPGNSPDNPLQQRRMVKMTNGAGRILWQHEIAAPLFLPPPP